MLTSETGGKQGSTVAMVGSNCVAIACDLRLGNQALTVATNFEKVRSPGTVWGDPCPRAPRGPES